MKKYKNVAKIFIAMLAIWLVAIFVTETFALVDDFDSYDGVYEEVAENGDFYNEVEETEQPVEEMETVEDAELFESYPGGSYFDEEAGYHDGEYMGIEPHTTRLFTWEFSEGTAYYQPNTIAGYLLATNPETFYFRHLRTHFDLEISTCHNRHGYQLISGMDTSRDHNNATEGHLVDFRIVHEEGREGFYTVAIQASQSVRPGSAHWGSINSGYAVINFQETSSFVDVEGVLNDPTYFVLDPSTVTVGRPITDTHGEYIHRWTIYRLLDDGTREHVVSGERNTWLDESTPRDIDVSDRTVFTPGRYIVVNTVEERTPLVPFHPVLTSDLPAGTRFPGGPFIAVEEGAFEIPEGDEPLPPTIEKVADREYVFEGEYITYTITVSNPNEEHVWEDLVVVDNIRIGLVEFLPTTLRINGEIPETGSWSFDPGTGELRVYIQRLHPDEEIEITFDVRVRVTETEVEVEEVALASTAGVSIAQWAMKQMSAAAGSASNIQGQSSFVAPVANEYVGFDPTSSTRFLFDVHTSTGPMIDFERVNVNMSQEYVLTNFNDSISFIHRLYINGPHFIGEPNLIFNPAVIRHSFEVYHLTATGVFEAKIERTAGTYIDFFNEGQPEGVYDAWVVGHFMGEEILGAQLQVSRILINIQRTNSFVQIHNGHTPRLNRDSSTAVGRGQENFPHGIGEAFFAESSVYANQIPIENPSTITVGRYQNNHPTHNGMILNQPTASYWSITGPGVNVVNQPLASETAEIALIGNPLFETNGNSHFIPDEVYTVRVRVQESVPNGYPSDASIWSYSYATFIFPTDDPDPIPGTIPNTAILYCIDSEEEVECGRDSEIVTVLEHPSITKGVNVAPGTPVEIGEYVTYTLTVSNPNDIGLEDFLVVDNLANGALVGVRNVSVAPDYGNEVLSTVGELSVFLDYLPANGSIVITFEARIAAGTAPGSVINSVNLYRMVEDEETGEFEREFINDDDATVILEVEVLPPTIEKVADREYVFEGEEISYTITVSNPNETHVWEDLVVVDNIRIDLVEFLPTTLRINGEIPETGSWSFDPGTGELRVYIERLHPDEEIEITFDVRVRVTETEIEVEEVALASTAGVSIAQWAMKQMSAAAGSASNIQGQSSFVAPVANEYVGIEPHLTRFFTVEFYPENTPTFYHPVDIGQNRFATNPETLYFRHQQNHFDLEHSTCQNRHAFYWQSRVFDFDQIIRPDYFIEGHLVDFRTVEGEGINTIFIQASHTELPGSTNWGDQHNSGFIHVNFQETSSFVDVEGVLNDPTYFVLDPSTVTVGRPSTDTHGEYIHRWTIYRLLDDGTREYVVSGERNTWLDVSTPRDIDVSDRTVFTPGRYIVVNTVEERTPLISPHLMNGATLEPIRFPGGPFIAVEEGAFEITEGDDTPNPIPGTIPNTAILYCIDSEEEVECGRDSEIVTVLERPSITKGVNVAPGTPVEIGEYVTYTLTVTNPNEVDLYNFLVIDNLANGVLIGVRNIDVTPDVGYDVEEQVNELRMLLDRLPAEGSVTITFEARVRPDTAPGIVVNTVHLYRVIEDAETGEREFIDEDDEAILLVNEVNLTFTKTDEAHVALPGAVFSLFRCTNTTGTTCTEVVASGVTSSAVAPMGQVNFTGLQAGGTYRLVETEAPTGFVTPTGHWTVHVSLSGVITFTEVGGVPAFSGTTPNLTLINLREAFDFIFVKTDLTLYDHEFVPIANVVRLPGALFRLERYESEGVWELVDETRSNAHGVVHFENRVTAGPLYRLTEIEAPTGFILPEGYWLLRFDTNGQILTGYPQAQGGWVLAFRYVPNYNNDGSMWFVGNMPNINLPDTGGSGSFMAMLFGGLVLTATYLLWLKGKLKTKVT